MNNFKKLKQDGFTLIELLVVISVIGILVALAMFGMQNSYQNARNTQRKSDLSQFRNTLEIFANQNNGLYPAQYANSVDASSTLCVWLSLTNCPRDPNYDGSSPVYRYQTTDGSGALPGSAAATGYIMWATLEGSSTQFWIVCSNGKSGTSSTNPSGSPVTSSVCN